MLNINGKSAIIYPTGTGKSLIGFKSCGDFSKKLICCFSPSDYIFKTRLKIPVKAKLDGEYVVKLNSGGFKGFITDIICFVGTIFSVLKSVGVI